MELWDLYTEDRQLTEMNHVRGEDIPDGYYHLSVHVWIRNSGGEYLVCQRSANRAAFPLMWETVGGAVLKGESSLAGAVREVKEERGINLQPSDGKLIFSKVRKTAGGRRCNDILDVWMFRYEGEPDLSRASSDEVAQSAWMSREQIMQLFKEKKFVETLAYFFTEVDQEG